MPTTDKSRTLNSSLIGILERRAALTAEQAALLRQAEPPTLADLEEQLALNYEVDPEEICLALAEHAEVPVVRLGRFSLRDDLLKDYPADLLRRLRAVPIGFTRGTVTLALADPLDVVAIEEVADLAGLRVIPVAALQNEVMDLIGSLQQAGADQLGEILSEAGEGGTIELAGGVRGQESVDIASILESAEEAPVIRIVNMILMEAINKQASDIHIETFDRHMRLRYRVDGVLQEGPAPPKSLQSAIISRVKIMSELDIAERRLPQDGRIRIKAQGREIDLRVSILPAAHGEKVCLRLLDKTNLATSLDVLGLDRESLEKLRFAIHQPHGLILVTGPTGSGKTTTLYSALQEINGPDVNITTVEDPVEYQIAGVNQVQVKEDIGLTFSAALRSILRQDPDIVLIGETRDNETADIAVKAALTGHLVLTTLHTNDAPSAIARLVYMGIEPFLLASCLLLAQAQRLVRRVCSSCKEPYVLEPAFVRQHGIDPKLFEGVEILRGRGCSRCGQSGYRGRTSIMEILLISRGLRELILRSANADDIKRAAVAEGFRDLRSAGFLRVKEGITSIEEVLRVTAGELQVETH